MAFSRAQINAADADYIANADYFDPPDISAARKFLKACRILLALPSTTTKGANSVGYNKATLAEQAKGAEAFLKAHSSTAVPGRTRLADLRRFRG